MPMIEPASVIWLDSERAMPKSVTFTCPAASTRTLRGLMSRWTRPYLCANASADRIWRVADRDLDRRRAEADEELLERPPVQVLHRDVVGALRLAAAVVDRHDVRVERPAAFLASRRKRSTNCSSAAWRSSRILIAIAWPSSWSSARYTLAMPLVLGLRDRCGSARRRGCRSGCRLPRPCVGLTKG